jgi:hypothetical protein
MNSNVKGMLFTAGAVVVGIVVAGFVQAKLLNKASASASDDSGEE